MPATFRRCTLAGGRWGRCSDTGSSRARIYKFRKGENLYITERDYCARSCYFVVCSAHCSHVLGQVLLHDYALREAPVVAKLQSMPAPGCLYTPSMYQRHSIIQKKHHLNFCIIGIDLSCIDFPPPLRTLPFAVIERAAFFNAARNCSCLHVCSARFTRMILNSLRAPSYPQTPHSLFHLPPPSSSLYPDWIHNRPLLFQEGLRRSGSRLRVSAPCTA